MSQSEDGEAEAPIAAPLTAGKILQDAGAQLEAQPGGDAELTKILKAHILVEAPAKDAADAALKAIVVLAEARAAAQGKPQVAGAETTNG